MKQKIKDKCSHHEKRHTRWRGEWQATMTSSAMYVHCSVLGWQQREYGWGAQIAWPITQMVWWQPHIKTTQMVSTHMLRDYCMYKYSNPSSIQDNMGTGSPRYQKAQTRCKLSLWTQKLNLHHAAFKFCLNRENKLIQKSAFCWNNLTGQKKEAGVK